MKRATKKFSAFAAILLLAAFVLCAFFVISQAEHDCRDAGCTICAGITQCLNTLNTEARKAGGGVAAGCAVFAAVLVLGAPVCRMPSASLVTLKTKLSD